MNHIHAALIAGLLFANLAQAQAQTQAQTTPTQTAPGYLPKYNYTVSDIATMGLKSQDLFDEVATTARWMDLHHSVCANRAHVWGYDLYRRHNIQPGRIFIFFTAGVWANAKKSWMYHAGTYVMENGEVKVLEGSYPEETQKPQSVVDWMTTEMEEQGFKGSQCQELTEADTDMTEYFYNQACLPPVRANGKPGAPCYYRKVPGYIPYPATVAELEFGVYDNGKPIDYSMNGFDIEDVRIACEDAYAGRDPFKRGGPARKFCKKYLGL